MKNDKCTKGFNVKAYKDLLKAQSGVEDFSSDVDIRGDYALFIETRHFTRNPWSDLDEETKKKFKGCQPTFFRVIHNGVQQSGHGWIQDGEIVQWG